MDVIIHQVRCANSVTHKHTHLISQMGLRLLCIGSQKGKFGSCLANVWWEMRRKFEKTYNGNAKWHNMASNGYFFPPLHFTDTLLNKFAWCYSVHNNGKPSFVIMWDDSLSRGGFMNKGFVGLILEYYCNQKMIFKVIRRLTLAKQGQEFTIKLNVWKFS